MSHGGDSQPTDSGRASVHIDWNREAVSSNFPGQTTNDGTSGKNPGRTDRQKDDSRNLGEHSRNTSSQSMMPASKEIDCGNCNKMTDEIVRNTGSEEWNTEKTGIAGTQTSRMNIQCSNDGKAASCQGIKSDSYIENLAGRNNQNANDSQPDTPSHQNSPNYPVPENGGQHIKVQYESTDTSHAINKGRLAKTSTILEPPVCKNAQNDRSSEEDKVESHKPSREKLENDETNGDEGNRSNRHSSSSDEDTLKWTPPSQTVGHANGINKESGAIPKTTKVTGARRKEKPWNNVCVNLWEESSSSCLEKTEATLDLHPIKMQYLTHKYMDDVKETIKLEVESCELILKRVSFSFGIISICVSNYPGKERSVIHKIVECLQEKLDKVTFYKSIPISDAKTCDALQEYVEDGSLEMYEDNEKFHLVGIVDKQVLQKIKTAKAKQNKESIVVPEVISKEMQVECGFRVTVLEKLGFKDYLYKKYPEIKVRFLVDKSMIVVEGNQVAVHASEDELKKFKSDVLTDYLEKDQLLLELLELSDIKSYIDQQLLLNQPQIKICWKTSKTKRKITVCSREQGSVKSFQNILDQSIRKFNFPIISHHETSTFVNTREYNDFVEENQSLLVCRQTDGNIEILTNKKIANKLSSLEEKFDERMSNNEQSRNVSRNQLELEKTVSGQLERQNSDMIPIDSFKGFHEAMILKKFDFQSYLMKYNPDFELQYMDHGIKFKGNKEKIDEEMHKFLIHEIKSETISGIPKAVLEFYDLKKEDINKHFENKAVICYWYTDVVRNCVSISSDNEGSLKSAREILKSVDFTEYTNTDDNREIVDSPEISSFLKKESKDLMVISTDDTILVVGLVPVHKKFVEIFNEVKDKLPMDVDDKDLLTIKLDINPLVYEYLQMHKKNNLDRLILDFNIEINVTNETVYLVGKQRSVKQAETEIMKHSFHVRKWSCEMPNPSDISLKLSNATLPGLQSKYLCTAKMDPNLGSSNHQQIGQWVKWNKGSVTQIVLIHGPVTEMSADIMVCPTTAAYDPTSVGRAIINKGGGTVKKDFEQSRKSKSDQIYLSMETGNLSCIMIVHLAIPYYETSAENINIAAAFRDTLKEADRSLLQSICFPLKISDRVSEPAMSHYLLNALSDTVGKLTNLKTIYICTEKSEIVLDVYRLLNDGIMKIDKEFVAYDFTECFENPADNTRAMGVKPAPIEINLVKGSLVNQKVDVFVNSCGYDLDLDIGIVSKTLLEAAGSKIQKEVYKKHPHGVDYGCVVCSTTGKMAGHLICHCVLPPWVPSADFSIQVLEKIVFNCLKNAHDADLRTLAFPVFGTGKLSYPWDAVARTMITTVLKFGRMYFGTTVQEVRIVLYEKDNKSIEAFESRKSKALKIELLEEDPLPPPASILESRCGRVHVKVVTMSDIKYHKCEALALMLSLKQVAQDKTSEVAKVGFDCIKNCDLNFMIVRVIAEGKDADYEDALKKIVDCSITERWTSIALCLMSGKDALSLKDQCSIVKKYISDMKKNKYLETVKLIVSELVCFNKLMTDTIAKQEEESKGFTSRLLSYFSCKKNHWKIVNYSEVVSAPRLIFTAVGEDTALLHKMKTELNEKVADLMKKADQYLGKTIRQVVPMEVDESNDCNLWIRVEEQSAGPKVVPLTRHICQKLDDAERRCYSSVEAKDGNDLYVFTFGETCEYFINDPEKGIKGIFYKQGKDGVGDQGSSVDSLPISNSPPTKPKPEMEIIEELKFFISPSYRNNKQQILDMITNKGLQFDEVSWEVTCSYENMICLNRQLKEKFQTVGNVVTTGMSMAHLNDKRGEDERKDDVTHIFSIKMKYMEFKMLQFFCPKCQIFKGFHKYENNILSRYMLPEETEDALNSIVQSKLRRFETYNTQEVPMPEGKKIDDLKWAEVKNSVNLISSDIFCFRSYNQNKLTLKSSQYEKLQTAKVKSEFVLGLKSQNQGRRNRVIATDAKYTKDDNEVPSGGKSDMGASSNFARSFSSSSSTSTSPSPSPPELTFTSSDGMIIKVYIGNILNLKVECIVNAANETLSHGGGVADVISRAAGYQFQDESDDYIQQHGSLNVTECCTTSAGNLKYKCVIHAVGPRFYKYPNDRRGCADDLEKTIQNCFHEANKNSIQSIALPAISSGIFGVPKEICSQQYCAAVRNYCNMHGKSTSLKEIHFMDKDTGMIQLIQNEFKNHLNLTQTAMPQSASATPVPSRISNFSDHSLEKQADKYNASTHSKRNSGQHGTKRQNSTDYKGTFSVDPKKFNRQFMTTTEFKVHVVQADITQLKVDVIICPQDEFCYGYGRIAKAIEKVGNEKYRTDVTKMGGINKCEVKKIEASPSTLPFKYVLHTVAPRWDKNAVKDNAKFMKDLGLTIRNILRHCSDSKNILTAAIPVLGVGADGHETPYVTYASILAGQITKESDSDRLKIKELYVVISEWSIASCIADQFDKEKIFVKLTSFQRTRRGQGKSGKDKQPTKSEEASFKEIGHENKSLNKLGTTVKGGNMDNCVICMDTPEDPRCLKCGHIFCHNCISQHFKINNPVCPTCGSIQGEMTGNQPPGTMTVTRNMLSLAGYPSFGRIEVNYHIPAGKQGPEHKTPGRYYDSINRTGYLPDNAKGQLVAKLLRVAFDRRLVFTIGDSRTTGKTGVVTWNDIHHKTNPKPYAEFGYPDPTYLDRVIDELAAKGVTKDDIKPDTVMY